MFTSTKLIHLDQNAIYHMIYPLAAFENCTLSFEEFVAVIEGQNTTANSKEARFVQNLAAACTYMLDTLNEPVSVEYACQINEILTKGRIDGDLVRDYEISEEDLEYIQILRNEAVDLSSYDLKKLVPGIPRVNELDQFMNISTEHYYDIIHDLAFRQQEVYAYQCFMPMIRAQYFKKSNIITGALIVSKIVLRSKEHLMFIEQESRRDLAIALLQCIYNNEDSYFQSFVDIMIKHRVEMNNQQSVKVLIHL